MAVRTISLTGAEVAVTGLDGSHAHITNMGADIIYAAKTAGISAGADGVVPIPAGNGNTLRGISGAIYLLGTGSALIQTDDYVQHPSFRNSTASGGSGVDDVARAALSAHEGNAEIHVTASEKASWDGKAELTDIPTSLPANGGNADTAKSVESETGKAKLHENNEGGQLLLTSPDGTKLVGIDMYANDWFRMFFINNGVVDNAPFNYDFSTRLFNIRGSITNADTLDGKHSSDFASVRKITTQEEVDSMLESGIYSVEGLTTPTTFGSIQSAYYMLIVNRYNETGHNYNVELAIPYINGYQQGVYYRICAGGTWGVWTNVADGGNAATLESHPASDFALKSDYDALAARVTALEGGTT